MKFKIRIFFKYVLYFIGVMIISLILKDIIHERELSSQEKLEMEDIVSGSVNSSGDEGDIKIRVIEKGGMTYIIFISKNDIEVINQTKDRAITNFYKDN
ncbi:MAG: hypothetical protein ACOC22_00780 [bacterium]